MKLRDGKIAITFACVILGMMLAVQFKSAQGLDSAVTAQRAEEMTTKVRDLEEQNKALSQQLAELGGGHDTQLKELRYDAGLVAVTGPGLVVTVDDSHETVKPDGHANLYLVHDEDLLRIINELRAAGAEAISINGQRLIGTSEIRCTGPNITVNGNRLPTPFEIKAIGNPKTLASALDLRGGVKENLKYWGIQMHVEKKDLLEVPAFAGSFRREYAKAVSEEGDV